MDIVKFVYKPDQKLVKPLTNMKKSAESMACPQIFNSQKLQRIKTNTSQ